MIDVKLPTIEELMKIDDVVFPEETNLNSSIITSQAQVTIPGSIILHQFEIKGSYSSLMRNIMWLYSYMRI